jgi:hypothetical protein
MLTLKLSANSEEYARALRVIGQELADLFPERVEIEIVGSRFVVSGELATNPNVRSETVL